MIVVLDTDQQSKRSRSGYEFERKIFADLEQKIAKSLDSKGCILVYGREPGFKKKYPEIWRSLSIRTVIGNSTGDTDIILFDNRRKEPFALISCKTSLRERITESLYYMRFYKSCYRRFLLFVVTEDKGYTTKGKWRSELGTEKKPTKTRVLATREQVSIYSSNSNTIFGGCVKPLSQLEIDVLASL